MRLTWVERHWSPAEQRPTRAFLLCTFWLAQALARAGQPDRAREVFERAAAFVNDVGLLLEEVDPVQGELLGNFPQAFSHIGLVEAAWAISETEGRQAPPGDHDAAGWGRTPKPGTIPGASGRSRRESPSTAQRRRTDDGRHG